MTQWSHDNYNAVLSVLPKQKLQSCLQNENLERYQKKIDYFELD